MNHFASSATGPALGLTKRLIRPVLTYLTPKEHSATFTTSVIARDAETAATRC